MPSEVKLIPVYNEGQMNTIAQRGAVKRTILRMHAEGMTKAQIAKALPEQRTWVYQTINMQGCEKSAWRRQARRKIETVLKGAPPAERKTVLDSLY